MSVYIMRRIVAGVFVLVGASFILYMLMTQAGNPLAFTLAITNPTQRASVINEVTQTLSLDVPPVQRYLDWLHRLVFEQDFGLVSTTQQPVSEELARRIPMTLKLVTVATVLSVVIGVMTGIVTSLRQYSGFDYLVTFTTFLFFSLPIFWVAVILKAWGGINLNDWLRDGAHFSPAFIVAMAILFGVIGSSFAGGTTVRRLAIGLVTAVAAALVMVWVSANQWLLEPGIRPDRVRAAQRGHRARCHRRVRRLGQRAASKRCPHHLRHPRRRVRSAADGVRRRFQHLEGIRAARPRTG